MKARLPLYIVGAFALLQFVPILCAQTTLGTGLDATNLVWTTGGTANAVWTYEAQSGYTFDGIDSARSANVYDNGETWIQTTVAGPGTISFWWQAWSEPDSDWLEFYIDEIRQARICGVGDRYYSEPSAWEYHSYSVPAGSVLKWRYARDGNGSTGGTMNYGVVDQVSYVTSPPPPLEQALNTFGVQWTSSGSVYDNGWFAQTNVTHDGQWAAQSGAIWHNQTNWLQAIVSGTTNLSFWWKVSSETNYDFLEFYTNGLLATKISGEVNWQSNFFSLPLTTNVLTWLYRKSEIGTANANCGWLDQVTFAAPITKADTATTVTASSNPSVFGQAVTFTATVNAGSGTPTGTVTFKDGNTTLGTASLSAGQASVTTASLAVASHSITATYGGDIFCKGSDNTASPLIHAVNPASTTTTVTSSVNPSSLGQSVSFTATVNAVTPGAGTPTGTVQFSIDGSAFGSAVSLSGGSATSATISTLSVAGHTVTAAYSGNPEFNASHNAASPLTQTVNKANTTTAVTSSQNPSVFGQSVVFTATVSASASGGTPTGTVQFSIDGSAFGSPVSLIGGSATSATISSLSAAGHAVTAVYSGDGDFKASDNGSSPLSQIVNKANTVAVVASSQNPSVFGQSVTFTATVSTSVPGNGIPTGTVTFRDGTTPLATSTLNFGQATCSSTGLLATARSITAVYNGDGNFNTCTSSSLTQTVNKADTSTAVAASVNPSVFGHGVTFTATVTGVSPGAGTPTGTVQFKTNGVNLGTAVTLSGGSATSPVLSTLPAGVTAVAAVYSGDAGFNTSNGTLPGGQTISIANSLTVVSSSANPSVFGQPVTFTATVSAVSPGTGTPTGTVQFKTNGVNFGSAVALSGGVASTPSLSSLGVGVVTVSAIYSGDGNFNGSDNTASPTTQIVNKAATATIIASSQNPSSIGDPITWTATVSAAAPGAGTPSGTVQFRIDGAVFDGPVTLSGTSGTSIATATLPVGSHTVTAVYSGDSHFNSSTAVNLTQMVNTSPVTPATGGTAISADTVGGAYTSLTGPVYTEPSLGAVGTGTIILNAPAGFVFDTGAPAPKARITGNSSASKNINDAATGSALAMTSVTATQLTLTITASSGSGGTPNILTWEDVRVRPVSGTPLASGNITKTGTASMTGVATGANFGYLAETAGAASNLVLHTAPSSTATAGAVLAQQPVVQIQDQFGNALTFANRKADNSSAVTVALGTGTAALQGTLIATAMNGLATFTNLSYNKAETITLQFSSGSMNGVSSGSVVVAPAPADRLVFETQPGSATCGSSLSPQPVIKTCDPFGNDSRVGLAANQLVTLALTAGTGLLQGTTSLDVGTSAGNGVAAFSDLQVTAVGPGKQLTASSTGLTSAVSSSFSIDASAVPSIINGLIRQPDGTMELRASGIPGQTYRIEAGTNLTSWNTIGTREADAEGNITFLDQDATNFTSRYYRTVSP